MHPPQKAKPTEAGRGRDSPVTELKLKTLEAQARGLLYLADDVAKLCRATSKCSFSLLEKE